MELNDKYKSYQNKLRELDGTEKSGDSLREFHMAIENIFDDIKSHKSARDFKWLFMLLLALVILASAIHIGKFGIGLNLAPPVLIAGFWIYYRYELKKAINIQLAKNKEIPEIAEGKDENRLMLQNRIAYILNGIDVLHKRVRLIRDQYTVFFPLFAILVIDIIRGPLGIASMITTIIIAVIMGGTFWVYYFRNDQVDLENAAAELELVRENLDKE